MNTSRGAEEREKENSRSCAGKRPPGLSSEPQMHPSQEPAAKSHSVGGREEGRYVREPNLLPPSPVPYHWSPDQRGK